MRAGSWPTMLEEELPCGDIEQLRKTATGVVALLVKHNA
jgi:hypothetical protein